MGVALDVEEAFDVEQPEDVEQARRCGTGPKRWNRPKDQPYLLSSGPRFARTTILASFGSPLHGATFKKRGECMRCGTSL